MAKVQTIKFGEFMNGEYKRSQKKSAVALKAAVATVGTVLITAPKFGYAATNAIPADVKMKVIHAFDPLVNLMVDLSIPISSVMIAGAALMIMIGQKEKGYQLLMNTALGYCLVQMTPLFIAMLSGIGSAIGG